MYMCIYMYMYTLVTHVILQYIHIYIYIYIIIYVVHITMKQKQSKTNTRLSSPYKPWTSSVGPIQETVPIACPGNPTAAPWQLYSDAVGCKSTWSTPCPWWTCRRVGPGLPRLDVWTLAGQLRCMLHIYYIYITCARPYNISKLTYTWVRCIARPMVELEIRIRWWGGWG